MKSRDTKSFQPAIATARNHKVRSISKLSVRQVLPNGNNALCRTPLATTEGTMNHAWCAAAVTSMALTDGRPTRNGSMTIANESVRLVFALAAGKLRAAVAIAEGIGLDIGIRENDDVCVVGRTREVRLIDGRDWRQAVAA